MAMEKTSATDNNDGFGVFADGYEVLYCAHLSLGMGVDLMPHVLASQTS
jgi:hypothetical protein